MRVRLEWSGGAVEVAGGRVVRAGGGPGSSAAVSPGAPSGAPDLVVALGAGDLRPGLINAHDHLHRNHYPRLGAPPYPDAYAWGRDLHARWSAEVERGRALDRRAALLFGALKNLLSGATTVVHHDRWEAAFEADFPVRVARVRTVHSTGQEPGLEGAAGDGSLPLCIHLSEGVTPSSAAEVRVLARRGLLDDRLLAVHAVGVDDDGVARLGAAGAAVVWCPTSNRYLFGRTAPRSLLESVDVLIGSDSLLTADGTLLDELRAARREAVLSDARLEAAVGPVAARRLGLPDPALSVGAAADLVHLRRPLLESTAADVALVMVGGVPRLADVELAPLFEAAGVAAERLVVGGSEKLVAAPLATVARRVVAAWPAAGRILAPAVERV